MKSLEELKALRSEMREKLSLKGDGGMRVVVGMADMRNSCRRKARFKYPL